MAYTSYQITAKHPQADGSLLVDVLFTGDNKESLAKPGLPLGMSDLATLDKFMANQIANLNAISTLASQIDTSKTISDTTKPGDPALAAWVQSVNKMYRLKRLVDNGISAAQSDLDAATKAVQNGYKPEYADLAVF
jgi:hypothetical protein